MVFGSNWNYSVVQRQDRAKFDGGVSLSENRMGWNMGILFLLPYFRHSIILRGIVYSLAPTLAQLFIVFPIKLNQGVMGLDLGVLTPLFVLFFNGVWGVSAAWWLNLVEKEP